MRDLLTALAGAVILLLVAALAVPPLIDWQAHRGPFDRAVGRLIGAGARTEGRIEVRLLPSPRVRIDRLRLGGDADAPGLDARFVKAEVALAPLLTGALRFTETQVGRVEIRIPATSGGGLRLPADWSDRLAGRDLAIDDLNVRQLLLTTVVPATGRTDQVYAEDVRLNAATPIGPWRVEGTAGGVPFRAAGGTPEADGRIPAKISGGGDASPRFEADLRIGLSATDGGRGALPEADGSVRVVVGPPTQAAGPYLPFSLQGGVKARGTQLRFEGLDLAIDPGGKPLRFTGSGRLDLLQGRAGLALEARRLDLDAFLGSPEGRSLIARGPPRPGAGLPSMLDLDLSVETATLGMAEWSGLAMSGTLERTGGLLLRRLSATAPGATVLTASGQAGAAPLRFTGSLAIASAQSDALGRYLRRLGAESPAVALLDGRTLDAGADVSATAAGMSVRNLRVGLGAARITGNARYTAGDDGVRGRVEAQVRASGIDVAGLPPLGAALTGLERRDLALTLEARDLRFGPTGPAGGTIAARILSDASGLHIDSLDVADLAGASADLSGRIGPDGTGRISGHLKAPVAAPLVALLERVWVDEVRLLPAFLREAPLDLAVVLDREASAPDALRTRAQGAAGGGTLDLAVTSRGARLESATATLGAPRAGSWFGRADIPGLQRPVDLRVSAERATGGDLALGLSGSVAGLGLATVQPVRLGPDGLPAAGEIAVRSADLGPFLALAGAARLAPGAWPAQLGVGLARAGGEIRADLSGQVAGAAVSGDLARAPDGGLRGSLRLDRLSLPQLAAALAIPPDPGGAGRFAAAPSPPPTALDLRVGTLDLGRGLTVTGAGLALGLEAGSLTLKDLTGGLAGGRLAGSVTIARDGPAAAVSGEGRLEDASIAALADGSPIGGRLSAAMRFTTRAEGAAGFAAGLAGSGSLTLTDVAVPEADPAALGRVLARALEIDDPLREGRLKALTADELSRAAARARGSATAPATIIGGVVRAGPIDLDLGAARWSGTLGYDLRDGRLDARGTLAGGPVPRGWSGGAPSVQFGLGGSVAAPERILDVGALSTGLAATVLQRELETIELTEADQMERQRRRGRIEMDRARAAALKAAADKAAADKAAADKAEEAQRQARLRAQQAAAEEAARQARARGQTGSPVEAGPPSAMPQVPEPAPEPAPEVRP